MLREIWVKFCSPHNITGATQKKTKQTNKQKKNSVAAFYLTSKVDGELI